MKRFDLSIAFVAIMIALGAIATIISVKISGKDDAPLEQFAEEVIKDTTGLDIDFTPEKSESVPPAVKVSLMHKAMMNSKF